LHPVPPLLSREGDCSFLGFSTHTPHTQWRLFLLIFGFKKCIEQ
jgi:hypothetical protein